MIYYYTHIQKTNVPFTLSFTHIHTYIHTKQIQDALARRSISGALAALLKPFFSDLEPATRQMTAIGRATLARLDTVPGGESIRSTLQLLGFVDEAEGGEEEMLVTDK